MIASADFQTSRCLHEYGIRRCERSCTSVPTLIGSARCGTTRRKCRPQTLYSSRVSQFGHGRAFHRRILRRSNEPESTDGFRVPRHSTTTAASASESSVNAGRQGSIKNWNVKHSLLSVNADRASLAVGLRAEISLLHYHLTWSALLRSFLGYQRSDRTDRAIMRWVYPQSDTARQRSSKTRRRYPIFHGTAPHPTLRVPGPLLLRAH